MSYPRSLGRPADDRWPELAVVGGGASAVCLLDALAEAEGPAGGIKIFETSSHLWRGRPFRPDLDTVRVNIPPDGMSVRFGDSGLFQNWLSLRDRDGGPLHRDPFCGIRFVPRGMFGDYLVQSARAVLARLIEQGWRVEVIRESVRSATPDGGGLRLETGRGRRFHADHVVLCVGRGKPTDTYGLSGAPGFVAEPYPLATTLAEVDPDGEIAVIGSGLTGVDVVLGLAGRGHRGKIRMLSRSGVLPMVRQRQIGYRLEHFTPEHFRAIAARGERITLSEVIAVMRAEFADAGEDLEATIDDVLRGEREEPVARLRRHVAEVDSANVGLRILQRVVPAAGPDVWPLLPEHEKNALLREHYRALMSVCCPMPPASAAKLLELVDADRLEIVSGMRDAKPADEGGFTLSTADTTYRADFVFNAVNVPADKIPVKAEPLITSIVDSGLGERHPRGGLHVDRASSRLTVEGTGDGRIHALGDLASGTLFFTFGLPSLVDRARDIAADLTELTTKDGVVLSRDAWKSPIPWGEAA
ncbi:FAD/NAD(P)-binding protein [Amycolatopsis sp. NPDC058986]|uniref:FAD/NAD(P)-binding protein n=1 Tax=unclassified Amycolatopsis TaxID=2618356 RepID=UPI00366C58DE